MPSTKNVYTAAQFAEVLQAVLYGAEEFNTETIRVTRSHADDDTLIVTIPNGQQFALVTHQMVPAAQIAA